jgi:hypothetical protein
MATSYLEQINSIHNHMDMINDHLEVTLKSEKVTLLTTRTVLKINKLHLLDLITHNDAIFTQQTLKQDQ